MISVIVPVYNVEKRIGKCIESILAQSYRDLELILIDDGSTDGSYELCACYAKQDSRIQLFTQKNSGVSAARNRGICAAAGEYIEFVDSDDYIAPDMVKTLVDALETTGADLAVCGIVKNFSDHDEFIQPLREGKILLSEMQRSYPDIFGNYVLYSPVNKLYKREMIQTNFTQGLSFGEDFLFNLSYLTHAESVTFVNKNLYHYVMSEDSLIHTYNPERVLIADRLYTEGLEFCRHIGLQQPAMADLGAHYLETVFYSISDMYRYGKNDSKDQRKILKKISQNPHIQRAIREARMPRIKQKVILFLMRCKMTFILHCLMRTQNLLR